MSEEWRDIPDFEWGYEVSSRGRVYSKLRKKEQTNGHVITVGGRMLRVVPCASGWGNWVSLNDVDGRRRSFTVGHLMAMAFFGLPQPGYTAAHKDGVRGDAIENIQWRKTHDWLVEHASKYTSEQITDIKTKYRERISRGDNYCIRSLAREFGMPVTSARLLLFG